MVHAVVPVAGAHPAQAVLPYPTGQDALDGTGAVLVDGLRPLRTRWPLVAFQLFLCQDRRAQVGHRFLQQPVQPPDLRPAAHRVGQPQQVVGDAGAHPSFRLSRPLRVPPVLHVTLLKLMGAAAQDLLPCQLRRGGDERPHVLELISEAVATAALVQPRPGEEATGDGLVQGPAVDIVVQRRFRGL